MHIAASLMTVMARPSCTTVRLFGASHCHVLPLRPALPNRRLHPRPEQSNGPPTKKAKPPPKSAAQSIPVENGEHVQEFKLKWSRTKNFTPSRSMSRSPYLGSPLNTSLAEFFCFAISVPANVRVRWWCGPPRGGCGTVTW